MAHENFNICPMAIECAGFNAKEAEKFGPGLMTSAELYLIIFQRMHEKALGLGFWEKFKIFAGHMMSTWAENVEDTVLQDPHVFRQSLELGNVRGFKQLDKIIGTTNIDDPLHQESILGSWSYIAANVSHAKLGGKYVKFLDLCAEMAVGDYTRYSWDKSKMIPPPKFQSAV